jgi:hypothetical protein
VPESSEPFRIREKLLILCEGKADANFLTSLLREREISGPQCLAVDGQDNFGKKLVQILLADGFEQLQGILLLSDCGDDGESKLNKLQNQIKAANRQLQKDGKDFQYPLPEVLSLPASGETGEQALTVQISLVPDDDRAGSLESLCAEDLCAQYPGLRSCLEAYLECAEGVRAWSGTGPPTRAAEISDKVRYQCLSAVLHRDPNRPLSMEAEKPEILDMQASCYDRLAEKLRKFAGTALGAT